MTLAALRAAGAALGAGPRPSLEEVLGAVASLAGRRVAVAFDGRASALAACMALAPAGSVALPRLGDPALLAAARAATRPVTLLPADPETLLPVPDFLGEGGEAPALVLLDAPWGAPPFLPGFEAACGVGGIPLVVDGWRAVGARAGGRPATSYGRAAIVPLISSPDDAFPLAAVVVDEPGAEAVLRGRPGVVGAGPRPGDGAAGALLGLVLRTVARDPRPYRLGLGGIAGLLERAGRAGPGIPGGAVLALALEAAASSPRVASMRGAHGRSLYEALRHAPGLFVHEPVPGTEPAPCALPLRVRDAARIRRTLGERGIPTRTDLLADLGAGAGAPADLVLLPVLPHLRSREIRRVADRVRSALLGAERERIRTS